MSRRFNNPNSDAVAVTSLKNRVLRCSAKGRTAFYQPLAVPQRLCSPSRLPTHPGFMANGGRILLV
jgi:hypothetical protein